MSWHYLEVPAVESSAGSYAVSLASGLLRSSNIQEKSLSNAKEMDTCQSSQSGTMLQPSEQTTQNVKTTLNYLSQSQTSLSYRVDFLAKIYHQQVMAQGLNRVLDRDSGLRWPVSLTKYDPQESLWKTHQYSLLGGLESFSETWPRWGIMQDGECWALSMSEHLTNGRESGSWQTPTVQDAKGRTYHNQKNGTRAPSLLGQVKLWPTPVKASADKEVISSQKNNNLIAFVKTFPNSEEVPSLEEVRERALVLKKWPTPRVFMHKDVGYDRKKNNLGEEVAGMAGGTKTQPMTGQLNPNWVEWLMGWPSEWTDLRPLETDKFPLVCEQPGNYSHSFDYWLASHNMEKEYQILCMNCQFINRVESGRQNQY